MNAARRGAAVLSYIGQGLQQLGADTLKGGAFALCVGQFNLQVGSPLPKRLALLSPNFARLASSSDSLMPSASNQL